MKQLLEDLKIIEPLHGAGCACPICVAERRIWVRTNHPLMQKEIKPTRVLIPVDQAIAQISEAIDCYQSRVDELQAELKILRDE
jgi:hypothetical protein